MIKVYCHTNLDDLKREEWPTHLPERPIVGDKIQSGTSHGRGIHFELKVVSVTWKHRPNPHIPGTKEWYCDVELHLGTGETILEFQKRFNSITRNF